MNTTNTNIDATFAQAFQFYEAGRLQEAFELSRRIINNNPKHADAALLLGRICYDVQDYESAEDVMQYAINNNPTPPPYYFLNLAMVFREQQKLDEAVKQLEKALELDPNYASGYLNLGHIHQKLGQIPQAISMYKKSVELLPDYEDSFYRLGTAHEEEGSLDAAIAYYLKARQLEPSSGMLCHCLGRALNHHGYHAEALWCYKRNYHIKKLSPNSNRIETNQWLKNTCQNLTGKILSVGSGDDFDKCESLYRFYFENADSYVRLDVNNGNKPDITGDIQNLKEVVSDESYDVIFCNWVLEHVQDIHAALAEIHRVAKANGIFIATLPLNVKYHSYPNDYHRFTATGIQQLFENKFEIVELKPIGEEKEFVLDDRLSLIGETGKTALHGFACMARKIV